MNIKLVASDLDGTIIDRNNHVAKKNFEAIKKIHKKNINFTVCTGKSYSVSKKICRQFNAEFGIFGNGTQIINLKTGKEIFRKTLSKQDLLFISTLAKRYKFHIHLYTDNEVISEKLEFMDLRNFMLKEKNSDSLEFKIVKDIINYIDTSSPNVFSIIVSTENDSLIEFKNLLSVNSNIDCAYINKRGIYKDLIIDKNYEYLNISPNGVNKSEALKELCKKLNISSKDILAIGDNVNDLEMVKEAGIGVAVNSSYDDLKAVATYVTKATATDGAFAEAISKYIN